MQSSLEEKKNKENRPRGIQGNEGSKRFAQPSFYGWGKGLFWLAIWFGETRREKKGGWEACYTRFQKNFLR